MARQPVKLKWPFGGIVEVTSYSDQPAGTTFDALNVRPHDSLKARKRGGQRAGLAKYLATAVNGSNFIQRIASVALAFDSTTIVADQELVSKDFSTTADGDLDVVDTDFTGYQSEFQSVDDGTTRIRAVSGVLLGGGAATTTAHYTPSLVLGSAYIIKVNGQMAGAISGTRQFGVFFRGDVGARNFIWCGITESGGNALLDLQAFNVGIPAVAIASVNVNANITADVNAQIDIHVNGNNIRVLIDSVELINETVTTFSAQTDLGLYMNDSAGRINSFAVFTGSTPASRRTVKLIVASGGNIYSGTKAEGLTLVGTSTFGSTNEVWTQDSFQIVHMTDGASYAQLNPKTNVVSIWQNNVTAGALPVGGNGTQYDITAVTPATPSFTVAEDLSLVITAGDFIEVLGSNTDNDQTYTVASVAGTGPTVITVDQAIQSSTVAGTLALGNVTGRFMALYRGRIVIAGLETDPQNWFMSKVGNALDWNYFPTDPDGTEAVAGNSNQAGQLEDIVTALVPYLDDVLYFGGDHTIWVLSGDPAENGRIDNVSRQIGIVGPEAHTFDTASNIYFLAQNGLYKVPAGSQSLESISKGRLDDTLSQLDFGDNRIRLMYDREWQGVHIFITPQNEPSASTDHYFWDERTDSFWRDQYPTAHGPTAVALFDADDFDDRAVLLGGFDSIIRFFDRTKKTDDGTTIHSYVRFTPLIAGDRGKITASETTINLATGSDSSAVVQFHTGTTAEAAAASTTIRAAKTLTAGRTGPMIQRVSGNSIIITIDNNTNDTTWAYENGSLIAEDTGVVRREEE